MIRLKSYAFHKRNNNARSNERVLVFSHCEKFCKDLSLRSSYKFEIYSHILETEQQTRGIASYISSRRQAFIPPARALLKNCRKFEIS